MSEYTPGTYVKGGIERNANSAREAVALVFEGFKPKAVEPEVVEVVEPVSEPVVAEVPVVVETPKAEAPKPRAPKSTATNQED